MFVGDNGQGDVRASEMMAEKSPELLEAVYMHRVRWRKVFQKHVDEKSYLPVGGVGQRTAGV